MKYKTILMIFIITQMSCAVTDQFHLYNPYPDKEIILEKKNVSCSDLSEIKLWYIFYGSYPLNTVNTKEVFPSPDYSYRIEQVASTGDKLLSLFTGLFFSISRKTLRVETCQVVNNETAPEKKPENQPSQSDKKLGELEKEVAFLKGKISGIETTVAMVSSNPSADGVVDKSQTKPEVENKKRKVEIDSEALEKAYLSEPNSANSSNKEFVRNTPNQEGILHSYLLFKTNSFSLNEIGRRKMEKLYSVLNRPNSRLLVVGYADKTGKFSSNLNLSWKRALEVKRILIELGIQESRIQLSAGGETRVSGKGKSDDLSRRVDLYLLEEKL